MKRIVFILFLLFYLGASAHTVHAQVRGCVYEETLDGKKPLAAATVYWAGTTVGISTDAKGRFHLGAVKGYDLLVASYVGMQPDTLQLTPDRIREPIEFVLSPTRIETVVVTASARGNYTSREGILKNENISFIGLTKMACCNLAESFENSASVTVGYSDAVSGTRQIRMLGLAGVYTQLLDETRPVMRGLASPYGLSYTPGMWLQSIQVSKGITSVTNGHEAITGQINLEHRKPTDAEPLFLNAYFDQELRGELNLSSSLQINPRLSTVVLAHGSVNPKKIDHNGDGFIDLPATAQASVANRWLYAAPNGIQLRGGFKVLAEQRRGGQMDFRPERDEAGTEIYGSQIDNRNLNGYLKLAIPLGRFVYDPEKEESERSNLAFILDADYYDTDSYFGIKRYRGEQRSLYLNILYSWNVHPRHKLIVGGTVLSELYDEHLLDGFRSAAGGWEYASHPMRSPENEAGLLAEYSYRQGERFSLIAGLRADYSDVHGWFWTPRAHIRWDITGNLALRASAGKGFRTARLITDNLWVLATGRQLVLGDELNTLEESFTYGGSLTWHFRLGNDPTASIGLDFFRSEFRNQVVADQEFDTSTIRFYNVKNGSRTNTYQVDFNWTPFTGFDVLATYRYNDTHLTLLRPGGTSLSVEQPLTDRFKALVSLQYATKFRKWVFDFTAQLNGQSRISSQQGNPMLSDYSPVYPLFFAQVTRRFGKASVYLGCENIGNYTQEDAVVSPDHPFDTAFNASLIWGPLMGRKIYAGVRINF